MLFYGVLFVVFVGFFVVDCYGDIWFCFGLVGVDVLVVSGVEVFFLWYCVVFFFCSAFVFGGFFRGSLYLINSWVGYGLSLVGGVVEGLGVV